jgi:hypothetical protein
MYFLLALAISLGSIEGAVLIEGAPLPGCTVTLGERHAVTNVDGRYRFENVAPGAHELMFELASFVTEAAMMNVQPGANAALAVEMKLDPEVEWITLGCSTRCQEELPQTKWELPACAEYEFDTALIEAFERGDRSAVALATARFRDAFTYAQKHRLAGALLGQPDDAAMWKELYEHAVNAVRFPLTEDGYTEDYLRWCSEEGVPPEGYFATAVNAFWIASSHPRARNLLHDALKGPDSNLLMGAVVGFAVQKDESALPAIERALARHPEDASMITTALAVYESEAADAIALKYMDAVSREVYLKQRASPEP